MLADNGSGVDWDPDANDTYNVTQVNGAGFTAGTPFALPSGALLTMNANGTFDYDPNGQFESLAVGQTASDTFTYTIDDGRGQPNSTGTATVTVTINGINDAPNLNLDANDSGGVSPNFAAVFDASLATAVAIADVDLAITDIDSATIASATVTISNRQDGNNELLSATPSGAITAGDISFVAASGDSDDQSGRRSPVSRLPAGIAVGDLQQHRGNADHECRPRGHFCRQRWSAR